MTVALAPPAIFQRRTLHWLVPLLASPVIFLSQILLCNVLLTSDTPVGKALFIVPFLGAFSGGAAALVFGVVAAVKEFARSRREGTGRYTTFSRQDAARRGLAPEEYGVIKAGDGGVTSASGLLFISLLLTVIELFVIVMICVGFAQDAGLIDRNPDSKILTPVEWFFVFVSFIFPVWSWRLYAVERRAQKVRVARGLPRNLR